MKNFNNDEQRIKMWGRLGRYICATLAMVSAFVLTNSLVAWAFYIVGIVGMFGFSNNEDILLVKNELSVLRMEIRGDKNVQKIHEDET